MKIIAPFPGMEPLAHRIAAETGAAIHPVALHRFPDGETLVTLGGDPEASEVAILATLRDPDRLALPLRFAALTARELGAARVGLVAPYLGYMRQDKRFHPREAVSAPIFAGFLEESFDWLVTVDPHLHRNRSLSALFRIPARRVATAPVLAAWIAANIPDAVLLGPDGESRQWVAEVATLAGRPYEVLTKHRTGDREVEISLPDSTVLRQGTPVILDDIASSGHTLVGTLEHLRRVGAPPAICMVIHAVFSDGAEEAIRQAGAARIVSTDTIAHPTNEISVGKLLATQMQEAAREA
ncbi:ribose-phosphate diphosphokinase [Breoghania sp.]|uniref:ribose-phosphate diphosphokinase n=1 Tax=Breoghania sp. TaxID=2065378 RepID=UPI002AA93017|nr:ribose-phosphate diphosphokinase [Breoghania sp.]